jgi:hypothetical protein
MKSGRIGGIVNFEQRVEVAVGVVLAAHRQHMPVGKEQQLRIPPAVGHGRGRSPLLGDRVEDRGLLLAEVVSGVVVLCSPGRKQAPIGEERVAAAEEIEWPAILAEDRGRVTEILPVRGPRVPHDARVHAVRDVTEGGIGDPCGVVT